MIVKVKGKQLDKYEINRRAAEDSRKMMDQLKGLTKPKGPQRGDYKMCRQLDKTLSDYRVYKNPKDREKIKQEYFGIQKEGRSGEGNY